MTMRHRSSYLAALCVTLAALSSYACDDDAAETAIGPSSFDSDAPFRSRAVTVHQADVAARRVPGALCPTVPPYFAPIDLMIRADGASDLFLREVRMQFIDSAGVPGAFRTIIGNELSTLFGSTRIPAFGARTFPVSLPFGCVGGSTGAVGLLAVVADTAGRENRTSLSVTVR